MWRIEVWKEQQVIETFSINSEEEVKDKRKELQRMYLPPDYTIKTEKVSRGTGSWDRISAVMEAILEVISFSIH